MDVFESAPPSHIKRERQKARELRKSSWWDQQISQRSCYYCKNKFKKSEITMDHKVPIIRGGKSQKSNVVPCCKLCNSEKGYMTDVEFLR